MPSFDWTVILAALAAISYGTSSITATVITLSSASLVLRVMQTRPHPGYNSTLAALQLIHALMYGVHSATPTLLGVSGYPALFSGRSWLSARGTLSATSPMGLPGHIEHRDEQPQVMA